MNTLEFCQKYLKNYTINSDNTIDVDDNVYLWQKLGDMEKLPVKFGKVSGYFDCRYNMLTTLDGCPNYVGGSFDCRRNNLSTLEGCPKYVCCDFGSFYCDIITHHILGNVQRKIYCNNKQRIVI
jgi:hypothetical protein